MDAVEIEGLAPLLEDESVQPPYLELRLRHSGTLYRAQVLVADTEWALTVTDEHGREVASGVFFDTQSAAVLGAALAVLSDAGL